MKRYVPAPVMTNASFDALSGATVKYSLLSALSWISTLAPWPRTAPAASFRHTVNVLPDETVTSSELSAVVPIARISVAI